MWARIDCIRFTATATLALLFTVPSHGAGSAAYYAQARKAFQDAYARALADKADLSLEDSDSLKAYPLYPYLVAVRIQQALSARTDSLAIADERAADFLAANAQLPVSRGVRRAWLDSLAQRSQWDTFLAAYRDTAASDAARCQSFMGRIALGKIDGLAADIAKQWLTPRSLPDCERPFAWLKENGYLTTDLIEQRARLALENSSAALARQIAQQLPADRGSALLQWIALLESPERSIDALIDFPKTPVDAPALLAGWSRLARTDRAAAKERYARLVRARGMSREMASPFALALALPLAWDRDPAALEYFRLVEPPGLDDAALEWRARAALWSRD